MTQFARTRDNILTPDERAKSARKCLGLLKEVEETFAHDMRSKKFYHEQKAFASTKMYAPSEPQLQWLRDLVSKYVV